MYIICVFIYIYIYIYIYVFVHVYVYVYVIYIASMNHVVQKAIYYIEVYPKNPLNSVTSLSINIFTCN